VLHKSLEKMEENKEEKKPRLSRSDSLVLLSEKIPKPARKISDILLGSYGNKASVATASVSNKKAGNSM
jgi:hypothetical protein